MANARCQTFARLIGRLSTEIQQLTREIPLREGQLLELEAQAPPNEGTIRRIAEDIRLARERLATAETDLVELEGVLKESCGSRAAAFDIRSRT
jgi:predicted  nucleic acid-binding Zn-ribbon protein